MEEEPLQEPPALKKQPLALKNLRRRLEAHVRQLEFLAQAKKLPELQEMADELSDDVFKLLSHLRVLTVSREGHISRQRQKATVIPSQAEQTQEEEQNPLMKYKALLKKITPWFGQDKEAASDFIRHCIGVDPTYITKMAGELWAEDILDDHHVHKRLWEALKEAGLYNYSLTNWNAQVGKAAQAKD